MDCRTARLLLSFARPCSTDREPGEDEDLEIHLAECPDCGALARVESKVDEHIGQAIRDVPVPEGLRSRLLEAMEPPSLPWYRRRPIRLVAGAGIAAAIALVVFLGLGQKKIKPVDFDRWADLLWNEVANPSADMVQRDFRAAHGIVTVAPADFNYALLTFHGLANVDGERVPLLVFSNGKQQARVWVLSRRFDIDSALAATPPAPSTVQVEMRPCPGNPQFAFLVVYTGDSLQPFLNEDPRPAL